MACYRLVLWQMEMDDSDRCWQADNRRRYGGTATARGADVIQYGRDEEQDVIDQCDQLLQLGMPR